MSTVSFYASITLLCGLSDMEDRSVRIPPDRAKEAGLRNNQVQINSKYGGGFPANVEGLHHLHCLVRWAVH